MESSIYHRVENSFSVTLTSLLSVILLFFGVPFFQSLDSLKVRLTVGGLQDISSSHSQLISYNFFNKLSKHEKTEFVSHVNFLTSIIRKRNPLVQNVPRLAFVITRESYTAKVDPLLALAVIAAESNFNTMARSKVGALGLMQVMPPTGAFMAARQSLRWKGAKSLYDPRTNLRLGLAYLRSLFLTYNKNLNYVLVAYNWGPGNLNKALSNKKTVPSVSKHYLSKVKKLYAQWQLHYERFNANKILKA